MARTQLLPQKITREGLSAMYASANADGNYVVDNDQRFLVVRNAGASTITVTLPTPGMVAGLAIDDRQVTVDAGEDSFIALVSAYRNEDGTTHVNYSAVADVSVALLEI